MFIQVANISLKPRPLLLARVPGMVSIIFSSNEPEVVFRLDFNQQLKGLMEYLVGAYKIKLRRVCVRLRLKEEPLDCGVIVMYFAALVQFGMCGCLHTEEQRDG